MTKEELDKKIKSFSEHNGLKKTYNYYELSDTGKQTYSDETLAAPLPLKVAFRISSIGKILLFFLFLFIGLEAFVICFFNIKNDYPIYYTVLASLFIFAFVLGRYAQLEKLDKKEMLQIIMTEEHISFNKDIYKWTEIETTFFKRDLRKDGKQLFLWVILLKKDGDLYYYQLKKFNEDKLISNGLKFRELLYLYNEHAFPDKNKTLKAFI